MNNLLVLMQRATASVSYIAGQIDFYDTESHQGTSIIPFLGFMMALLGLVITFIGIVKINNAKRQWNLFYDSRDRKDLTDVKYKKEKKQGIVLTVIGVVMLVASFIILP